VKKLRVKILVLAVVLVAGVFTVLYATREPSVDGRTLSEWLRIGRQIWPEHNQNDVTNAVRKIGTKGIPVLLDKLRARDSEWKHKLDNKWGHKVFSDRWFDAAYYDRSEALLGFSILGSEAASTIPELSKFLIDTNQHMQCAEALGYIGPPAFPVLRQALTNQDESIRVRAVLALSLTPEGASLAVPQVLALRQHTNRSLVGAVLLRVTYMLPKDEALRVLTEYTRDPRWQRDSMILLALGFFQTNTPGAVPLVAPFLTDPNLNLRKEATNTLRRWGYTAADALRVATNSPAAPPLRN
jgi:hypothetical protein